MIYLLQGFCVIKVESILESKFYDDLINGLQKVNWKGVVWAKQTNGLSPRFS